MTLFAFGDHHARSVFGRCANLRLHGFGPYSMDRVGGDGAFNALQLVLPRMEAEVRGTMIFMVGAEDVRRRLVRRAVAEGCDAAALIDGLAERYVERLWWITTLVRFPLKVCAVGVVPPAGPRWDDPASEAIGSFEERCALRDALNAAVRARCRARDLPFVPVPALYETRRGALRPGLSDGCGRIAPDHAHHLCAAVERAIGADLGHRRPDLLGRLGRGYARARAIRNGDAATLRAAS